MLDRRPLPPPRGRGLVFDASDGARDDPSGWLLDRWLLRFKTGSEESSRDLEAAWEARQAQRFAWPVRVVTAVFFCVNAGLIYYDWQRYLARGGNPAAGASALDARAGGAPRPPCTPAGAGAGANATGSAAGACEDPAVAFAFAFALLIRLAAMLPLCAGIVLFTLTRAYRRSAQPLVLGVLLLGAAIISYTAEGGSPGYGALALLIVYVYSFTPLQVFRATAALAALIAAYGAALAVTRGAWADATTPDGVTAAAPFGTTMLDILGVLVLFMIVVGYIGHNLEFWLRLSFLDEARLRAQKSRLLAEHALSAALLGSMLPPTIIRQLNAGRTMIADAIPEVTVLFAELQLDLFSHPPATAIAVLNLVYSAFDSLIDLYLMHKVETVGEVYLCAAGCPEPTPLHAAHAADMALGMMASLPLIRQVVEQETGVPGSEINIRVGLNSGPVAAGVVGIKSPRYKLIGDTVNTASRMESTSVPGRVQISASTKAALDRTAPGRFHIESRGEVPVKGKGVMYTYWLVGQVDAGDGGGTQAAAAAASISNSVSARRLSAHRTSEPPGGPLQSFAAVPPAAAAGTPAVSLSASSPSAAAAPGAAVQRVLTGRAGAMPPALRLPQPPVAGAPASPDPAPGTGGRASTVLARTITPGGTPRSESGGGGGGGGSTGRRPAATAAAAAWLPSAALPSPADLARHGARRGVLGAAPPLTAATVVASGAGGSAAVLGMASLSPGWTPRSAAAAAGDLPATVTVRRRRARAGGAVAAASSERPRRLSASLSFVDRRSSGHHSHHHHHHHHHAHGGGTDGDAPWAESRAGGNQHLRGIATTANTPIAPPATPGGGHAAAAGSTHSGGARLHGSLTARNPPTARERHAAVDESLAAVVRRWGPAAAGSDSQEGGSDDDGSDGAPRRRRASDPHHAATRLAPSDDDAVAVTVIHRDDEEDSSGSDQGGAPSGGGRPPRRPRRESRDVSDEAVIGAVEALLPPETPAAVAPSPSAPHVGSPSLVFDVTAAHVGSASSFRFLRRGGGSVGGGGSALRDATRVDVLSPSPGSPFSGPSTRASAAGSVPRGGAWAASPMPAQRTRDAPLSSEPRSPPAQHRESFRVHVGVPPLATAAAAAAAALGARLGDGASTGAASPAPPVAAAAPPPVPDGHQSAAASAVVPSPADPTSSRSGPAAPALTSVAEPSQRSDGPLLPTPTTREGADDGGASADAAPGDDGDGGDGENASVGTGAGADGSQLAFSPVAAAPPTAATPRPRRNSRGGGAHAHHHLASPPLPARRGFSRRASDAGRGNERRRSSARWYDRLGMCLNRPMMRGPAAVLEREFQAETLEADSRFARGSAALGVVVLLCFLAYDYVKYGGGRPNATVTGADGHTQVPAGAVWLRVALIRYVFMAPVLLAYLCVSGTRRFARSWAMRQAVVGAAIVLLGVGVIAITIVGLDPGYGLLAVYLVVALNFGVLALVFRIGALVALVATYIGAVMLTAEGFASSNGVAVPLLYLVAFTLGEAVPVVLREHAVRQNYFRRVYIEIERRRLTDERARTDRLLENLLPPVIVPRLRAADRGLIADEFADVTVLWTDIKGFTAFSASRPPLEVVAFLNAMFSTFDRILDKYGVRKVEVLGDAFFVVGGCPVVCDDHAERCANAALEMLEHLPILRRFAGTDDIDMRVGLHTGPVMAGVVGQKNPRYHLFGATVPFANAMESHGVPGRVHISATTHAKLRTRQLARAADFVRAVGGGGAGAGPGPAAAATAAAAGATGDGSSVAEYCRLDLELLDLWHQSRSRDAAVLSRAHALALEHVSAIAAAAEAAMVQGPGGSTNALLASFGAGSGAGGGGGGGSHPRRESALGRRDSAGVASGAGSGSTVASGHGGGSGNYRSDAAQSAGSDETMRPPSPGGTSPVGARRGGRGRARAPPLIALAEAGPEAVRGQVQVWQGAAFLGWDVLANTRTGALMYERLPPVPGALAGGWLAGGDTGAGGGGGGNGGGAGAAAAGTVTPTATAARRQSLFPPVASPWSTSVTAVGATAAAGARARGGGGGARPSPARRASRLVARCVAAASRAAAAVASVSAGFLLHGPAAPVPPGRAAGAARRLTGDDGPESFIGVGGAGAGGGGADGGGAPPVTGLYPTSDSAGLFSVAGGFFAFEERSIELRGVPGQTTYFMRRADPPFVPELNARLLALQRALERWAATDAGRTAVEAGRVPP